LFDNRRNIYPRRSGEVEGVASWQGVREMTQTPEEARLSILLHQSRRSEDAMARHLVALQKRLNSVTADKVAAEAAFETLQQELDRETCKRQAAEREVRRLKVLRYAPKKAQGWVTA
jgi:hypothetical protein